MWFVQVGQPVGGNTYKRDFIIRSRENSVRFTVTLRWSDRYPHREQEERAAALILKCVREIAVQDDLPIRR